MRNELPFAGFNTLVRVPLEKHDSPSYTYVAGLFLGRSQGKDHPFTFLMEKLSGQSMNESEARRNWSRMLAHKKELEDKLGRPVFIQAAVVDYFSLRKIYPPTPDTTREGYKDLEAVRNAKGREEWWERMNAPSFYVEKLKDEIRRASRYHHALAAILLDVDHFHRINEGLSYEAGDEILGMIVKILRRTIRNVDVLARYSGDRFLVILPNTNEREALELAERIRQNVSTRTRKMQKLSAGITVTLSVAQSRENEKSSEFARRLEKVLESGKNDRRDAVYAAES